MGSLWKLMASGRGLDSESPSPPSPCFKPHTRPPAHGARRPRASARAIWWSRPKEMRSRLAPEDIPGGAGARKSLRNWGSWCPGPGPSSDDSRLRVCGSQPREPQGDPTQLVRLAQTHGFGGHGAQDPWWRNSLRGVRGPPRTANADSRRLSDRTGARHCGPKSHPKKKKKKRPPPRVGPLIAAGPWPRPVVVAGTPSRSSHPQSLRRW